jgi:hypothetical protein
MARQPDSAEVPNLYMMAQHSCTHASHSKACRREGPTPPQHTAATELHGQETTGSVQPTAALQARLNKSVCIAACLACFANVKTLSQQTKQAQFPCITNCYHCDAKQT